MANGVQQLKSVEIRARLNHPVIDSDGHTLEPFAIFFDYLKSVAGEDAPRRFNASLEGTQLDPRWQTFTPEQRRALNLTRGPWWAVPAMNTLDLATAMMPKLMYERLDEMGLDFAVVYPTIGLITMGIGDEEMRRASCRALNIMKADTFSGLSDRLAAVATIPMHTPQEAIDELEYSVTRLGLKAAMMASYVRRPISHAASEFPQAARFSYWLDTFGIDSEYDYDPVWAKCVELGIAPTFHSVGYGWGSRASISNYIYNHIGNFASSAEAICKSLFMGGVPVRFPKLRFAFLEGGAAWARSLYCELISHWEKRNREAVEKYNPARADRRLLTELARRYGGRLTADMSDDKIAQAYGAGPGFDALGEPEMADEWAQSGVHGIAEIRDIFTERFYFGCEGDDPLVMTAFNPMGTPFNAVLRALYGSDVGHWDVPDMSAVTAESCELVEKGLMSVDNLRDFLFANAVEFWTATNPGFFKGTRVEVQVNKLLAAEQ
jgi:predicted TIM-barrel fold metal-dependent hydrolase